jgi:hypothetical protein
MAKSPNMFTINVDISGPREYYSASYDKNGMTAEFYEVKYENHILVRAESPFLVLSKGSRSISDNYREFLKNRETYKRDMEVYALFTYVDMLETLADKFSRSLDIVITDDIDNQNTLYAY